MHCVVSWIWKHNAHSEFDSNVTHFHRNDQIPFSFSLKLMPQPRTFFDVWVSLTYEPKFHSNTFRNSRIKITCICKNSYRFMDSWIKWKIIRIGSLLRNVYCARKYRSTAPCFNVLTDTSIAAAAQKSWKGNIQVLSNGFPLCGLFPYYSYYYWFWFHIRSLDAWVFPLPNLSLRGVVGGDIIFLKIEVPINRFRISIRAVRDRKSDDLG